MAIEVGGGKRGFVLEGFVLHKSIAEGLPEKC